MPTPAVNAKINTLIASMLASKNSLTKLNENKMTELKTSQTNGDVKQATTLSTDIESRNIKLQILDKMSTILKAYQLNDNVSALLEDHRELNREYPKATNPWHLIKSISSFFIPVQPDVFAEYHHFVETETKPLVIAEKEAQAREAAQLAAYFRSSEGQEMANAIAFIRRG